MHNDIQIENIRSCPACGCDHSAFFCTGQDRLYRTTELSFEYRKCQDCHTVYQSTRPIETEVWKCYPETYGPHAALVGRATLFSVPDSLNRNAQKLADKIIGMGGFRRWMGGVRKRMIKAGEILDFGCGSGAYLNTARKLGCKTLGVDFSPRAVAEATRQGHEALEISEETWGTLRKRRLKFVRLNHVVEHLYNPAETLTRIFEAMDVGGFLHLSTPNSLGPSATQYGNAWWGLECPRHIVLMPPAQLSKLLEQIGFRIVSTRQEPVSKDMLRSWAYKKEDRGGMKNQNIEKLASDGILNLAFSFNIVRHMRRTGQGDRYHILAQKISDKDFASMNKTPATNQDNAFSENLEVRTAFVEQQYEHLWKGVEDKFDKVVAGGEGDLSRVHLFMRRNFGPDFEDEHLRKKYESHEQQLVETGYLVDRQLIKLNDMDPRVATLITDAIKMRELVSLFGSGAGRVVELGSGWGKNLFNLFKFGAPLDAEYWGFELTRTGRQLMEKVGQQCAPTMKLLSSQFNYYDADFSPLNAPLATCVLTHHSIEQIPEVPEQLIQRILQIPGFRICVHMEPVGFQIDSNAWLAAPADKKLMAKIDSDNKRFAEKRNQNKNLYPLLRALEAKGQIKIISVKKYFTSHLLSNATTVIAWAPANTNLDRGRRDDLQ